MPNDTQTNNFQIESFEPRHLKKARIALDKHLQTAKKHTKTNDDYKKSQVKNLSLWSKIKHILHLN